jgi:hypothetical protein
MKISLIDKFFSSFNNRAKFFRDGIGDYKFLNQLDNLTSQNATPAPITVQWSKEKRYKRVLIKDGQFMSPCHEFLPDESAMVRFRILLPLNSDPQTPVCIHLAATGDEGYGLRNMLFARPLLRHGIGSIILQNPYYGDRRPQSQERFLLREFSDLFKMTQATITEGLTLVHWLREAGYRFVGITGLSMGGSIAAFVGAMTDFPISIIPITASYSPAPIFLEGLLRNSLDWTTLKNTKPKGVDIENYISHALKSPDIRKLDPPAFTHSAIIIGALRDGYVSRESVQVIYNHWHGSELVWIKAGHIGSIIFHHKFIVKMILKSIERLQRA